MNKWKALTLKWKTLLEYKATTKTIDIKTIKNLQQQLSRLADETLALAKQDSKIGEATSLTILALFVKMMNNPNAVNDWLAQESQNWTNPEILKMRLDALEKRYK